MPLYNNNNNNKNNNNNNNNNNNDNNNNNNNNSNNNSYSTLATTHHFVRISVETGRPWNPESSEFISELGKRIFQITLEPLKTKLLSKGCPYRCRGEMN